MASYNCSDSSSSAYGTGGYGTCESIGAPNTGVFGQFLDSGSFTIIAPLVAAIVIVAAIFLIRRRKRA